MNVAGETIGGRFELRRRIGAGGMGEVFEAYDQELDRLVALKTLARLSGDALPRFKREFRALQSVVHTNLVSLLDLGCDEKQWFFTMELISGRGFLEHITGDPDRLRPALRQLAEGLRALHGAGLIHRDVKPSNVLVSDDGRVVLLDFGLVTASDPARQSRTGTVGTVEYMSPEQAVGGAVTEASDWYAVGVLLYEALTGRLPHLGRALQVLVDKQQVVPEPPESLAPDAPADLAELCRSLLAIEPSARPDSDTIARRLGIELSPSRPSRTTSGFGRQVFVGRERELATLRASLDRIESGPAVHLVVGESGIGKSVLVAHFSDDAFAADRNILVLRGRCYERESVPYKALDGVVDGICQHLMDLPRKQARALLPERPQLLVQLFPVFQRVEVIAAAPAHGEALLEPHERRRRSFAALRSLFVALCSTRTILITIDDLHWADADSMLLLNELLRGDDAPRLLVVATARPVEGADAISPERVRASLSGATVEELCLGPLSEDESRALAERLLPSEHADIDLATVVREASGHPMFLREVVQHMATAGSDVPVASFDGALRARIDLLQAEARELLETICIAGAPISMEVAASACRLDPVILGRASASLRVAVLARELQRNARLALEPYHDRVREGVVARLGTARRTQLHARLAAALESSGEPRDPQQLLRHFRRSGQVERAARYAEEAAQRSYDANAFDQAAEMWRTALDLVERGRDERRPLLQQLGAALVGAGRCAEAADIYLEAAEGADGKTRLECHRCAAEQLLISGRIERGLEVLSALLAEIGVHAPRTPRRALLSLLRGRLWLRLRGLRVERRERHEIAESEFLRLEALRAAAQGLAVVDAIRGADFYTRHLLVALELGHAPSIMAALLHEADTLASNSHMRRAEKLIERTVELLGDTRDDYVTAEIQFSRAMIAYFKGDSVTMIELGTRSEQQLRRVPGSNWERASIQLFILFAMRFVGDYGAMSHRYEEYSAEARQRGDQYLDSTMRRVCVPMWLAFDDPATALRELELASWVPESVGYHVQHFHELVARGEVALYTGAPADRAALGEGIARLRRSMLLRITSIRIQHDYLIGRLALAGGDPPRVVERLARGLGRLENSVARTWAPLLRAGAASARGESEIANQLLEEAEAAAEAAHMALTAAAARLQLAGLRDDGERAAAATAEMRALGVAAPRKMASMLAPMPALRERDI